MANSSNNNNTIINSTNATAAAAAAVLQQTSQFTHDAMNNNNNNTEMLAAWDAGRDGDAGLVDDITTQVSKQSIVKYILPFATHVVILVVTSLLIVTLPLIVSSMENEIQLLDLASQREWIVAQEME